jgi:hypothetical protein
VQVQQDEVEEDREEGSTELEMLESEDEAE